MKQQFILFSPWLLKSPGIGTLDRGGWGRVLSFQAIRTARRSIDTCHLGMRKSRALGLVIFSLIGLKRILFTNIFRKPQKPNLKKIAI